jgi:hypothetical protein
MNANVLHRYALIISCSYIGKSYELKGTYNNGKTFYNYVNNIDQIYNGKIIWMNDRLINTDCYPTKNNIINKIKYIFDLIYSDGNDSEFILYYSGHGSHISGDNINEVPKDNILAPLDYDDTDNNENKVVITNDELKYLLTLGKHLTRIYLIFDCHHRGAMCDLKYTYSFDPVSSYIIRHTQTDTNNYDTSIKSIVLMINICEDDDTEINTESQQNNKIPGLMTSSFVDVIKTSYSKDIFSVAKLINQIIKNKNLNQYIIISSNIELSNKSNEKYRILFENKHNSVKIKTDEFVSLPDKIHFLDKTTMLMLGSSMNSIIPAKCKLIKHRETKIKEEVPKIIHKKSKINNKKLDLHVYHN